MRSNRFPTLSLRALILLAAISTLAWSLLPAQSLQPGVDSAGFSRRRLTVSNEAIEAFVLRGKDTVIHLRNQFVIEGSEQISRSGRSVERSGYVLGYRFGTLRLLYPEGVSIAPRETIVVSYKFLPLAFQESYRHRIPVLRTESGTGKKEEVAIPVKGFALDDIFGSGLQKSGSIVRGFSLGSNRDLSLNSGFRMQMSGKVGDNVDVLAALTDENIPLQPEGTTQNLREIDKVFIEIKGRNLGATLGDFILSSDATEFGQYSRKVQGAKGDAVYRSSSVSGNVTVSAASARGKYATNQIQGLDAVQGPYRLTGRNNERDIIVIAGTERVYLNGEQLTRGDNNDYTIDYSIGEVTFTPKRLITRASRITIDYQYTDRQYNRNMLAAGGGTSFLDGKLWVKTAVMRESDDKDSPVELSLSDSDRAVLTMAGADPARASRSGVVLAGPGQGQYVRIDTMILSGGSPVPYTYYRYAPTDSMNAVYSVTFSYVGVGNGDYNRIAAGQYQFAGIKGGSYEPVRFLPLPESHSVADVSAGWNSGNGFTISGEGAFSQYDRNQFSSSARAEGAAFTGSAKYVADSLVIGGKSVGGIEVNAKARSVGSEFSPLDRIDQPEFTRQWNLSAQTAAVPLTEQLQEGSVRYRPGQFWTFSGGVGRLRKGDALSTSRYKGGGGYSKPGAGSLNYSTELLKTDEGAAASTWLKDNMSGELSLGALVPGFRYDHEFRLQEGVQIDTGLFGSFRFHEIAPRLLLPNVAGFRLLTEFGLRIDDSLSNGALARASQATTERFEIQPPSNEQFSSSMMLTLRSKRYADIFRTRNTDVKTTLLRVQARYSPLNRGIETEWFYDAASERSAKNERIFQQVPKGTGNYAYLGDLNNNHIADEQEFQLTRFDGDYVSYLVPSEQFIPVTDLKATARIRLNGNRLIAQTEGVAGFVSQFSTETALRVNEKSTLGETKRIYLLQFSDFMNDKTTLEGSNQITQDLFFRESATDYSVRLRFDQKQGFTQYSIQNERVYYREQGFRLRWRLVDEIANQLDLIRKTDILSSTQASFRVRQVAGFSGISDWSYRPEQQYELGFKFGFGSFTNADTTRADMNDQSVRFVYSIATKGQFRAEFSREEALIARQGTYLPFELTNGRITGKTWLWRGVFDYRVTSFISASVAYDGRSENGGSAIHTGRAEVKALF